MNRLKQQAPQGPPLSIPFHAQILSIFPDSFTAEIPRMVVREVRMVTVSMASGVKGWAKDVHEITTSKSSAYLFGNAVRIVCGCLAVVISFSQVTILSTEAFTSCPGHYVHWDQLGDFYQGIGSLLLGSLTEWRVMPDSQYGVAAVRAVPVAFLGCLGLVLACFAKTTWPYPRFIVSAACTAGFLLVPALGLLQTIKTFEAFGDM